MPKSKHRVRKISQHFPSYSSTESTSGLVELTEPTFLSSHKHKNYLRSPVHTHIRHGCEAIPRWWRQKPYMWDENLNGNQNQEALPVCPWVMPHSKILWPYLDTQGKWLRSMAFKLFSFDLSSEVATGVRYQNHPSCSTRTAPFLFAFHLSIGKIFTERDFPIFKIKSLKEPL